MYAYAVFYPPLRISKKLSPLAAADGLWRELVNIPLSVGVDHMTVGVGEVHGIWTAF